MNHRTQLVIYTVAHNDTVMTLYASFVTMMGTTEEKGDRGGNIMKDELMFKSIANRIY